MIVNPTNKSVTELTGLHLYHADMSNCSMRVRMVLKEKNLPWISHHLDLRKEAVTPEYFGIHPQGLVPTLVHDGVVHIESNDIIEYLDATFPEPPLQPTTQAPFWQPEPSAHTTPHAPQLLASVCSLAQ